MNTDIFISEKRRSGVGGKNTLGTKIIGATLISITMLIFLILILYRPTREAFWKKFIKKDTARKLIEKAKNKMEETALVSACKFDTLVQKIEQEKEKRVRYHERQNKLRVIFKSIVSVFFFLTKKMGMPRTLALSLEDFETAEEKLKELAKEKVKGRHHKFLRKIGFKTAWQYYHEFGFFHYRSTPFGYWYNRATGLDWNDWNIFDPEYIAARGRGYAVPPNARQLMEKIYQKRYGDNLKTG